MRRVAIFAAGVLLLATTPGSAHAVWPFHHPHYPHHQHYYYAPPAAPLAAPFHFQLPFGFGLNLSGLSVQGPLGNRIELGDRGGQQPQPPQPPPPLRIDDDIKRDLKQLKADQQNLLDKVNKLGRGIADPATKKAFEDLKADVPPARKESGLGGNKDKGGVADPPGE